MKKTYEDPQMQIRKYSLLPADAIQHRERRRSRVRTLRTATIKAISLHNANPKHGSPSWRGCFFVLKQAGIERNMV